MKKTVRHVRMAKGRVCLEMYQVRDSTVLWKLRVELNLTARDLHGASPFLPAERDPDHMLAWREGDVRRRVPPRRIASIRDFNAQPIQNNRCSTLSGFRFTWFHAASMHFANLRFGLNS
jgi:hypothetical protein